MNMHVCISCVQNSLEDPRFTAVTSEYDNLLQYQLKKEWATDYNNLQFIKKQLDIQLHQ